MLDSESAVLRKKMMGVKIQHARNKAGLSQQEIAEALGASTEIVAAIEFGQRDASLPQLEVMAFLFDVPVAYFWSEDPIAKVDRDFPTLDAIALRQRIIGVLLRQLRAERGRTLEDLAEQLSVTPGQIASYELGKSEIPVQELEILARYLNVALDYFLDEGLPTHQNGKNVTLDELSQFSDLPPEVREFLLNPANLLYVNIAMRLSGMSAETLRSLAEGLLEVTY